MVPPIIATKVGGIPNVIVDDFSGYLLDSHHFLDISQKIKILFQSSVFENKSHVAGNAKLVSRSFTFSSRATFLINNLL